MQEVKITSSDNIGLSFIRTDGGTQARAGLNEATVIEYLDAMREGVEFPPVVLFYDGTDYWLADGFHRVEARRRFKEEGRGSIIAADVRQGTRRDAVLYAAGANDDHGLRRSADDKRRAVLCLLEDKEWGAWADRAIARQCRVSPTFVGKVRAEAGLTVHVDSEESQERTYTTRHGTTTTMDTSNIGTAPRNLADGIKANVSDSAYESILSLQNAVLTYYKPFPPQDAITLLENLKADHRSSAWSGLSLHLGRNGKIFRVNDLRQAVNNALDSMRFTVAQATISQPSEPAQETPVVTSLVDFVEGFVLAYKDPYTRDTLDIPNPSHTNGTFWQAIKAAFARDGITYRNEAELKIAIKRVFARLKNEPEPNVKYWERFAPDEEQPASEPVAPATEAYREPTCSDCGRLLIGTGFERDGRSVCYSCRFRDDKPAESPTVLNSEQTEPAPKPRIAPFVMGHFQVANEALARIYTAIPKSRTDDIHDFAALIATLERLERRIGAEYDMS